MGRRQRSNEEGVSLFPFMSILACLIGILTLLIAVTMMVKQQEKDGFTKEELAKAEENQKLKQQAEELKSEISDLDKRVQSEKKTSFQLAEMKEKAILLQQQLEDIAKSTDKSDAELQKLIENLKTETKQIESEQPVLEKQRKELLAKIEKLKLQPKPESSVIIQPGGIGSDLPDHIYFVECSSTGIIIHQKNIENTIVSTAAISTNDAYSDFCAKVKRKKSSMILFLVRKTGNNSYRWAAGIADSKFEINTGKLPVPNEGEIDLSLFKRD